MCQTPASRLPNGAMPTKVMVTFRTLVSISGYVRAYVLKGQAIFYGEKWGEQIGAH